MKNRVVKNREIYNWRVILNIIFRIFMRLVSLLKTKVKVKIFNRLIHL